MIGFGKQKDHITVLCHLGVYPSRQRQHVSFKKRLNVFAVQADDEMLRSGLISGHGFDGH